MSKEHIIEISSAVVDFSPEKVEVLDDVSLALVGGGQAAIQL